MQLFVFRLVSELHWKSACVLCPEKEEKQHNNNKNNNKRRQTEDPREDLDERPVIPAVHRQIPSAHHQHHSSRTPRSSSSHPLSNHAFLYNGAPDVHIPYSAMHWEKIDLPNDPPSKDEDENDSQNCSSGSASHFTPETSTSSQTPHHTPIDPASMQVPLTLLNAYPLQHRSVAGWREPKDTTLSSLFYGAPASYYARDRPPTVNNSYVFKPAPSVKLPEPSEVGMDYEVREPASLPQRHVNKEKLYLGDLMQRQRENYLQAWMN